MPSGGTALRLRRGGRIPLAAEFLETPGLALGRDPVRLQVLRQVAVMAASGRTMNLAPRDAASVASAENFSVLARTAPGSLLAWRLATRTVIGGGAPEGAEVDSSFEEEDIFSLCCLRYCSLRVAFDSHACLRSRLCCCVFRFKL